MSLLHCNGYCSWIFNPNQFTIDHPKIVLMKLNLVRDMDKMMRIFTNWTGYCSFVLCGLCISYCWFKDMLFNGIDANSTHHNTPQWHYAVRYYATQRPVKHTYRKLDRHVRQNLRSEIYVRFTLFRLTSDTRRTCGAVSAVFSRCT